MPPSWIGLVAFFVALGVSALCAVAFVAGLVLMSKDAARRDLAAGAGTWATLGDLADRAGLRVVEGAVGAGVSAGALRARLEGEARGRAVEVWLEPQDGALTMRLHVPREELPPSFASRRRRRLPYSHEPVLRRGRIRCATAGQVPRFVITPRAPSGPGRLLTFTWEGVEVDGPLAVFGDPVIDAELWLHCADASMGARLAPALRAARASTLRTVEDRVAAAWLGRSFAVHVECDGGSVELTFPNAFATSALAPWAIELAAALAIAAEAVPTPEGPG